MFSLSFLTDFLTAHFLLIFKFFRSSIRLLGKFDVFFFNLMNRVSFLMNSRLTEYFSTSNFKGLYLSIYVRNCFFRVIFFKVNFSGESFVLKNDEFFVFSY